MLSNALWIMPAADRSSAPGTATIYYRCGSQQGKPAVVVDAALSEPDFVGMTGAFVLREVSLFRAARSARQKNFARNLKKFFDEGQIATISGWEGTDDALVAALLS
jgi:hypothetical protein